jgi:hypothetical protein
MRNLMLGFILVASSAAAQDGFRETDIKLTKDELTTYLSGQVLSFYNDGISTYQADGVFTYQYSADGKKVPGVYEVKDDSSVCTVFANGFERCDYVVQAGARYALIVENGDRYPVKTRKAIE